MKLHSKIISRNNDKERLPEVASLIRVAVWRQFVKERDILTKKSLDSCLKWSVNAPVLIK